MKTDLHTHTIASGHAFGTIFENAKEAKKNGLKVLAITDHGPAIKNAPFPGYFNVGYRAPKEIDGVRILFGVEANIINNEGQLDLPDEILKKLDVVLAGLHFGVFVDRGVEKNTEVLIKAMDNPYVKIISHPYSRVARVDMAKVVQAAIEKNILLEVNASYICSNELDDPKTLEELKIMIKLLKAKNQKLLMNSDAHNPYEVGRFEEALEKLKDIGVTKADFLNTDPKAVLEFLNIKD